MVEVANTEVGKMDTVKDELTTNENETKQASENEGSVKKEGQNKEEITDEYHYTHSGEYTCEMFKVVVQNLPTKVSYGVSNYIILFISLKIFSSHKYPLYSELFDIKLR